MSAFGHNLEEIAAALGSAAANGWRSTLEVLILTVGIYYVLRFIRGTRGAPVVTGFLVVLLTFALASFLLQLKVLQYLFGAFSAFSLLAVLVIFQPELRRLLAELGNLPLFATAHEQRENIEVIIQTVERLADVRIGALIALEQSIHLQEAVESGIVVGCEATPEMLETIFFPNNAIHDGGVIIKGDKIAFAACIFPLTQRQDLNPSLGTRHRAAIGLSEETDAAVVVVSEETGGISYAYKGQLTRNVTLEQLRAFLTSLLVKPAQSRNWVGGIRHWARERVKSTSAIPDLTEGRPIKAPADATPAPHSTPTGISK
jgi:diadenylate cyclase